MSRLVSGVGLVLLTTGYSIRSLEGWPNFSLQRLGLLLPHTRRNSPMYLTGPDILEKCSGLRFEIALVVSYF